MFLTLKTKQMNCIVFHNNLEASEKGQIPHETLLAMTKHAENCKTCAQSYTIVATLNKVIEEEQLLTVNPFMSTRVMAAIDRLEVNPVPRYILRLKPVFLVTLVIVAILTGILAGSFYKPSIAQQSIPDELVYINDAELEALSIVANE